MRQSTAGSSSFSLPFRCGFLLLWIGAAHGTDAGTVQDHPADACLQAARIAAAETGVPETLLRAIAQVETGRRIGQTVKPWPWAVNDAGQGHWFATRAEAEAHVQAVLESGRRSVDIGCFQLNHRWHGDAFPSVSAMFDPVSGARHAARFLAQLQADTGDWLLAAGAYHSRTPHLSEGYRRRVAAVLELPDDPVRPAPQRSAGAIIPLDAALGPLLAPLPGPLFGG